MLFSYGRGLERSLGKCKMWHLHRNFLHDLPYDWVVVPLSLYLDVAGKESAFLHFSAFIFSIMHHAVCLLAMKDILL